MEETISTQSPAEAQEQVKHMRVPEVTRLTEQTTAAVAIAVSVAAARSARLVAAARICGTPMSFPQYCTAAPGPSERPSAPHTLHLRGGFANGNSLLGSGGRSRIAPWC